MIGAPAENHFLKHGVSFQDFVDVMRDRLITKLDYGYQLLPLFNEIKDLMESYGEMPEEHLMVTNLEKNSFSEN